MRFLILTYLWVFGSLVDAATTIEPGDDFQTPSEQQECWNLLNESDADGDGFVSTPEFVTFAQLITVPSGSLDNITKFRDLPETARVVMLDVACLCQDPDFGGNASDTECCQGTNAKYKVTPSPSTNISTMEQEYLHSLCSMSYQATKYGTNFPTIPTPTSSPAAVAAVTMVPSGAPIALEIPSAPVVNTIAPSAFDVTTQPTVKLNFTYGILVKGGNTSANNNTEFVTSYTTDLIDAMNIMSANVLETTYNSSRRLRFLVVAIDGSSNITNMTKATCPSSAKANTTDLCKNVTHQVIVFAGSEDNVTKYQSNMKAAIQSGEFAKQLNTSSPDAPLVVITNMTTTPKASTGVTGISIGGLTGIVIVIFMVITFAITFFIFFRRHGSVDPSPEEEFKEATNPKSSQASQAPRVPHEDDEEDV